MQNLLLAVALLLWGCAASTPSATELPETCRTHCVRPFGERLGASPHGVVAWSNCSDRCVVLRPNHEGGTYTGVTWQCVEYARRWLLVRRGLVFGDVDVAADIWTRIDHLAAVPSGAEIRLEPFVNGSETPPRPGDLLVWGRELLGTGHVAIVVRAHGERVEVAEQNFLGGLWTSDHARTIPLVRRNGRTWLLDAHLIGWKRPVLPE